MRLFLPFFLLFCPPLYAQGDYWGPVAGFSSTRYLFDTPARYPGTSSHFSLFADESQIDFFLGAEMVRPLSGHWGFKLGLRLASSGYSKVEPGEYYEIEPGTVVAYPDNRLSVSHIFIEIPLTARYVLWNKKWSPYAEAGISTNTYLITPVVESLYGEKVRFWRRNRAVNPTNLRAGLSVGIQIKASKDRLCWFGQVSGRRQMLQIEKDTRNPYTDFAIETGCRFRLKQ